MSFAQEALAGSVLTVETAGFPAINVDLAEAVTGEQGLAVRLLRPRVTIRRGNLVLFASQPAGRPEEGIPWGLLFIGLAAMGLFFLLRR